MKKLSEVLMDYGQTKISKLGMLLTLNDINLGLVKDKKERKKSRQILLDD